ncbi:unnamed protein product [Schistocephalus solidus]|uniref:FAS1 domain-containing protein n=1 Tax=Schistocephalus solidus TaxID=70667 RepID=A0A183TM19_SCHSO|nr:unnamed protein product [Schistocephalus solidus]
MQRLGLCLLLPLLVCVSAALGTLVAVEDLKTEGFDTIVFVSNLTGLESGIFDSIVQALNSYSLINAPTGALNRDYDDSRRIYEAAKNGVK